jgi:tRNA A-37 threonylcarbamoyl transferase component Bud32
MQKIYQGAEAIITRENGVLKKERIKKGYRIEKLDNTIRQKRTKLEARLLREARRAGVMTPQVIEEERFTLSMEFVAGKRVKDIVGKNNHRALAKKIGEAVAKLHNYNIVHGDLTTSNMILKVREENDPDSSEKAGKSKADWISGKPCSDIYFIDFGLGFFSQRAEDKATDLHLLHEAIQSTHFNFLDDMWKIIIDTYKNNYAESEKVIKTLSKIEKRGRYVDR